MKNSFQLRLWGNYALFTDPVTKLGGEKYSYHIPTYEALIGVAKSIYWKPTIKWVIDRVRVMKQIQTQTKGIKPIFWHKDGNDLSIYNYLHDVEYQIEMHFEWNFHRPELAKDQIDGKHYSIVTRSLARGGRQDIFLGTRECQGYVEPCKFGEGIGAFDKIAEITFGIMFHGFDYPDENGNNELHSRFWRPIMKNGVIDFIKPSDCEMKKFVRNMEPKKFGLNENMQDIEQEGVNYGLDE